jgi:hypothetical protein
MQRIEMNIKTWQRVVAPAFSCVVANDGGEYTRDEACKGGPSPSAATTMPSSLLMHVYDRRFQTSS